MIRLYRWLLVLVGLSGAGAVFAQTTVAGPSAAQQCLTRGDVTLGTPDYPQREFESKQEGAVLVELRFDGSDTPPKVEVLAPDIRNAFVESVLAFARAYRVPCLENGQTARLRQEFVFRPTDGRRVQAFLPADGDARRAARLSACMKHADGVLRPNYPDAALSAGEQGTVFLRLKFADANSPPQVTSVDRSVSRALVRAATHHAEGLRMPCHEGAAVQTAMMYTFLYEGGPRVALTDPSFVKFLGAVKDIRSANVYFDFNAMGCPFDLRLHMLQPFAANQVGELDAPRPERRFFMDWLSRQQLDLDARTNNMVLGQHMDLRVPCTVLSLGNAPGGGASQ
jgi:hypothetical protein